VQFVSNNNRPFVTTEISATGLTQPLILRFLDSDSGTVLDEMLIGPTQGEFVDRTIPLRARNLSLEIVSTSAPAIHGSVLINRVVGPPLPTSNGEPQGWTAGLTRIDLFENDDDQTDKDLAKAGRSVALLQISGIDGVSYCTGYLVGPKQLATAAHCVRDIAALEPQIGWATTVCHRIGVLFDYRNTLGNDRSQEKDLTRAVHCTSVAKIENCPSSQHLADWRFNGIRRRGYCYS
jgi:hypothetical protein